MTKIIQQNNSVLHQCEECELKYKTKETAEQCQAWCSEHSSCNLDIIKYAVQDEPAAGNTNKS